MVSTNTLQLEHLSSLRWLPVLAIRWCTRKMPGRILGALENVSELENLCTLSATEGQLLARWYASPRRWCPPRGHRMVPRPPIVLNHVDARVIAPHRRGEFSAPPSARPTI